MQHSSYRFLQMDVFTDQAFAGNPLAVFPEAEGLSDEVMMKIAREMNLSETVFVLPSDNEEVLRRLRIFTPAREIPFAGHPVVGTWNALAREGVVLCRMGRKVALAGSAFITRLGSECCRWTSSSRTGSRCRS